MNELIEAIKAWPIIVQGALGSALFWLILLIGQKLTSIAAETYSRHSKTDRHSWLITASFRYQCILTNDPNIAGILLFRSARPLYKALMWVTLGLSIQSILETGGIIGFGGGIFYLLKAYSVISPMKKDENTENEFEKISNELTELEGNSEGQ